MSNAAPGESSEAIRARAYDRILKVARTIADLEGCDCAQQHHIMEVIAYRNITI